MIYIEIEGKKIAISDRTSTEFNNVVKEELKDKSYRGDLVNEDGRVFARMSIYGTLMVEEEVFKND